MRTTTLTPGVELTTDPSVPNAEAERFARLWGEVWSQCDPDTLARTLAFVDLCTAWLGSETDLATTTRRGTCIYMQANAIPLMPDAALRDLIAHELAHVYQYATDRVDDLAPYEIEDDALNIAERWGFDGCELREWQYRHAV